MNGLTQEAVANGATAESKKKRQTWWNVREAIFSLHGLEAARAYDKYLKEHSQRLKDLANIAGYAT
jgi:hypothetical protein